MARGERSAVHRARGILVAALLALAPAGAARALTLGWDDPGVTWPTTGTRSMTYTVGSGTVSVSVSDPGGVIAAGTGPAGAPGAIAINNYLDPVGNGGASSLFLKTNGNTAAPWVQVTFDFSYAGGVTDVDFSLYDIDLLPHIFPPFILFGYTDQVQVTASDGTNTYDPASVTAATGTPSWTYDGAHTVTGTANVPETGGNSADGTATFHFDQVITSFSVLYQNVLTNGQTQWIGFSAITFRQAPEPSTGALLALGLLSLAVRGRLRRG